MKAKILNINTQISTTAEGNSPSIIIRCIPRVLLKKPGKVLGILKLLFLMMITIETAGIKTEETFFYAGAME